MPSHHSKEGNMMKEEVKFADTVFDCAVAAMLRLGMGEMQFNSGNGFGDVPDCWKEQFEENFRDELAMMGKTIADAPLSISELHLRKRGEQIVGGMGSAAAGMNMHTRQFVNMVRAGKITPEEIDAAIIQELAKDSGRLGSNITPIQREGDEV